MKWGVWIMTLRGFEDCALKGQGAGIVIDGDRKVVICCVCGIKCRTRLIDRARVNVEWTRFEDELMSHNLRLSKSWSSRQSLRKQSNWE